MHSGKGVCGTSEKTSSDSSKRPISSSLIPPPPSFSSFRLFLSLAHQEWWLSTFPLGTARAIGKQGFCSPLVEPKKEGVFPHDGDCYSPPRRSCPAPPHVISPRYKFPVASALRDLAGAAKPDLGVQAMFWPSFACPPVLPHQTH